MAVYAYDPTILQVIWCYYLRPFDSRLRENSSSLWLSDLQRSAARSLEYDIVGGLGFALRECLVLETGSMWFFPEVGRVSFAHLLQCFKYYMAKKEIRWLGNRKVCQIKGSSSSRGSSLMSKSVSSRIQSTQVRLAWNN
jgi:hypothetical protein